MSAPLTDEEIDRLARRRAGAKLGWYIHAAVYLAVNLFLFAISDHGWGGRRWTWFPALGWGLGLALHGISVFVLAAGAGLRERLVQRERERLQRERRAPMRFDPLAKLQNLLHGRRPSAWSVAAVLVAFNPEQPYAPPLVFSLCIGLVIWAIVDLGRHCLPVGARHRLAAGRGRAPADRRRHRGRLPAGHARSPTCSAAAGACTAPARCPAGAHAFRSSVLITLIAGVTGSYYFYSRSRGAYLERQMREAQRLADDARLKLLETQLEPHMLFNTLANLRALIGVDPQRAQQMLDHMIAYLRSTLDASRATTHPLQAEFDRLRDYLELMAIRMGPRLAYQLALPPELAQRPVPTLLLQPLVENAIRHGLEPQVGGGRLDVSARQDGSDLVLDVLDTGTGPGASSTPGSGFGLAQVRERLATLYGPAARLSLEAAQPRGTRVSIRLPALTA